MINHYIVGFFISLSKILFNLLLSSINLRFSFYVTDLIESVKPYLVRKNMSEYVFLSPYGNPYSSSSQICHAWRKMLEDLNISYRTLYQIRHTFASQMLSNGEDMMWVSAMLGHKNANITLEYYGRYIKRERGRKKTFFDIKTTYGA